MVEMIAAQKETTSTSNFQDTLMICVEGPTFDTAKKIQNVKLNSRFEFCNSSCGTEASHAKSIPCELLPVTEE